ncbi:MAG TPA: trypsin-like peptidase domain-containing protein [Bryobacteraceae bacterium]|nr:trypsin-like peptidase domain-containing protein [Bryobacteraceae bacterium]
MDERIIIRHLSASKANQVEEFPLKQFQEITIGREEGCQVKYDADREDLVSRKHTRITVVPGPTPEFTIADLGSRNGTFVNKKRIFSPVKLSPGDLVQFGAGGPEFQFDIEPKPQPAIRPTRFAAEVAPAPEVILPPTREASMGYQPSYGGTPTPPIGNFAPPMGVGKATVERMITQSKKQTRTQMYVVFGAVLLVILSAVGFALARKGKSTTTIIERTTSSNSVSPTQVAQAALDSVVLFEVGWKLVDVENGRQVYHVYSPNVKREKNGKLSELVPGAGSYLPVFVPLGNNMEPMLTTDDGGGKYKPIGGRHTGSGFVVSSDGFLLTNRHVAASWYTRYNWDPDDHVGLVLEFDENMQLKRRLAISAQQFPAWVPANGRFMIAGTLDPSNVKILTKPISGKTLEGRNDYMDVTFAKNRVRIPGKLARVSDEIDVAMVKIDLPRSLKKLDLNDNYDSIKPGDAAIVMGYPAVSPAVVAVTGSKDVFNPQTEAKVIPDPTVSVGNIGRVIRGSDANSSDGVVSTMGDLYQLTVNSTGGGNSGGPVFDDQGRVIAIYTSGRALAGATVSFAVPIRYGMELMGVNKVTR